MMDHEFMNAPNPVWKEEFDKLWMQSLASSNPGIALKGIQVQAFIENLLDKQREEIIKLIEGKKRLQKPTHGTCCTCQTCGGDIEDCDCKRNLIIDELLTEIKKGDKNGH